MYVIDDQLDPEVWIADERPLLDCPIFEPFVELVLRDKPALAAHINRWVTRISQTRTNILLLELSSGLPDDTAHKAAVPMTIADVLAGRSNL
jgi:hypothetical protein